MDHMRRLFRRFHLQLMRARDPLRPRIFGVGLSKTATTSLCDALDILGFKTIHYAPIVRIENGSSSLQWPWWIEDFDAMADLPVAVMFRQLAERFPTSTFILTHRDEDDWLSSAEKHFSRERVEQACQSERYEQGVLLDRFAYGTNIFDEKTFRLAFRQHNSEVRDFFRGSPRFYELDICGGDGWCELSHITGRSPPDLPFPKSNVRATA